MKARVKETGKEFKVRGILTPTADAYAIEEVDLLFDESDQVELLYREDYWERLKHEYAGMAMQGLVTRGEVLGATKQEIAIEIADISDIIAHALVEKLKESK
mgnify:CR=1 FL=1